MIRLRSYKESFETFLMEGARALDDLDERPSIVGLLISPIYGNLFLHLHFASFDLGHAPPLAEFDQLAIREMHFPEWEQEYWGKPVDPPLLTRSPQAAQSATQRDTDSTFNPLSGTCEAFTSCDGAIPTGVDATTTLFAQLRGGLMQLRSGLARLRRVSMQLRAVLAQLRRFLRDYEGWRRNYEGDRRDDEAGTNRNGATSAKSTGHELSEKGRV